MLRHPSRDSQDVRVKDDVPRVEPYLIHKDLVGALADPDLVAVFRDESVCESVRGSAVGRAA